MLLPEFTARMNDINAKHTYYSPYMKQHTAHKCLVRACVSGLCRPEVLKESSAVGPVPPSHDFHAKVE